MEKLESRSLAEQAADNIEQLIIENRWTPGEKLPNEMDMVEKLGVGRGTVREAIKILESRNVVEIRRGKGTFVCDNIGKVGDPLGFRFASDKKKLAEDLSDFRAMLEPQIAEIAAQKATDKDIEELQRLCSEVEHMIINGENYSERDVEFHTKIASVTGNSVVEQIIPLIAQGVSIYVDLTNHELAGTAVITYQKVVDAIRNHDSDAAYEAMKAHMKENRENLELLKKK